MENNNLPKKEKLSTREMFTDLIQEAVGIENGFARTTIDLFKNPSGVVNSYLTKQKNYQSPFKYYFTMAAIFLILANFTLDWEAMFTDMFSGIQSYASEVAEQKKEKSNEEIDELMMSYTRFLTMFPKIISEVLKKYYVPFDIAMILLLAGLNTMLLRKQNTSFADNFVILLYRQGVALIHINIIILLLFLFSGFTNITYLGFYIAIVLVLILTVTKTPISSPLKAYVENYPEPKKILKAYGISFFIFMVFFMIIGVSVGLYFLG